MFCICFLLLLLTIWGTRWRSVFILLFILNLFAICKYTHCGTGQYKNCSWATNFLQNTRCGHGTTSSGYGRCSSEKRHKRKTLQQKGGVVFEALRYKPEGRGFDSRWCHWIFSLTQSFRSHYGPGVNSTSSRNEHHEYFLGVKAAGA
jgi:hypothetical protein